MSNPFTARRVLQYPWQLWQIVAIGYGSAWQIHDATMLAQRWVSFANLAGVLVALLSMIITDRETSRSVERWAYVMLIWSMSVYLSLALAQEGLWGLVNQPNFGVLLSGAVILAAIHRIVWTIWARRSRRKHVKVVNEIIAEVLPVADVTAEEQAEAYKVLQRRVKGED